MRGMIVYSFAWRRNGHSPCNVRLAEATRRIIAESDGPFVIHAQRSVAIILEEMGIGCDSTRRIIGYEGSEEPNRQGAELFRQIGITEVIPVANPFIHLIKCMGLVRAEGFKTPSFWRLVRMIGWIGFDRESVQPATRDPFRFMFYAAKQVLFGYRSPAEESET